MKENKAFLDLISFPKRWAIRLNRRVDLTITLGGTSLQSAACIASPIVYTLSIPQNERFRAIYLLQFLVPAPAVVEMTNDFLCKETRPVI